MTTPQVQGFFDPATFTVSYVVSDPATSAAAIIDPVLEFDPASGRTSFAAADRLIDYVNAQGLAVEWILETHVHADHLTAAPYIREKTGSPVAIGEHVVDVQKTFARIFNLPDVAVDGSQFDQLLPADKTFSIGKLDARVMYTPGHTPACVTYVIGDAAFVGDTLFMPDYGTARTDFPGGDAGQLYDSIQSILALPDETRLFMCHDYKAPGRDEFRWETTVAEQRRSNIHIGNGVSREDFVAMREGRDAGLGMPRLILPAIQVNIRAGHLPAPESNGTAYLKLPLNAF
tara:strand:+ start:11899 stop:12762 length:864 start_codon:yes stop_codon:yes gene_type:complete